MAVYNGSHVEVGPGTLYAAPLGTTEPTSVTGAWPAAWTQLGFTAGGTTFTLAPKWAAIEVEEEIWPVRQVPTGADATMDFMLAETTAQNLMISLNNGLGTTQDSAATGVNPDGSIWVEPPAFGSEVVIMLGWDALGEGSAQGLNPFGRTIFRQCLQTGSLKIERAKGTKLASYSCTFSAIKPPGATQPFRFLFPAALAS